MIVFYSKNFDKAFVKLTAKKQDKVIDTIELFQEDPFHPILKNHKLKGQKKDFRAFSVGVLKPLTSILSVTFK